MTGWAPEEDETDRKILDRVWDARGQREGAPPPVSALSRREAENRWVELVIGEVARSPEYVRALYHRLAGWSPEDRVLLHRELTEILGRAPDTVLTPPP